MPVSITLKPYNSSYKPTYGCSDAGWQNIILADYIVTQPYREETVICMDQTPASSPSYTTQGHTYFNTTDKALYVYNGTAWVNDSEHLGTKEEGFAYVFSRDIYYYDDVSQSMVRQTSMASYQHIYLKLESMTGVLPISAKRGMWYYSSSDTWFYYYDGYRWVQYISSVSIDDTWWFAYNGFLWYYSTAGDTFYYCYESFKMYPDSTDTSSAIPRVVTGVKTVSSETEYDWVDNSAHTYTAKVIWYNDRLFEYPEYPPESSTQYETFKVDGTVQGKGGDLNATLSITTSTSTYVTAGTDLTFSYTVSPTTSSAGSLLIPVTAPSSHGCEQYGVKFLIGRNSVPTDTEYFTIDHQVSNDNISLTSIDASNYNTAVLSFKLNKAGTYYIKAYVYHYSSYGSVDSDYEMVTITVVDESAPTISVYSVSPDPDVYPPPYTVVLQDTSASTQVPQNTITMDAGDNDDVEIWTLTNSGTTHINMPNKTHIYNGYGAYRPTIEVVDKNGNTSSGSTTFAPSKTARTYTPSGWSSPARLGYNSTYYYGNTSSTVSVSCGNAPVLLTAEAGVAGDPLPDVTWTYSLSGGTYTGETTGEYAELSLLYAGTYSVTCTIKNGTTTLATYTWSVTVQSELVSSEADKTMPDFGLIVCNGTTPIDYCKSHICPQYTSRWQDSDTVQFELPVNYQYAPYLQEGDIFIFGYQGAKPFIVSYRQQSRDTITITGTAVFPERVAITATRSTANDGYDVQKAPAEALVRYFVHTSLTDPYSTAQPRTANFMIHGTCQDYPTGGDDVTYSARYERVQDIINEICETSGIGYYVGVRNMSDGSIDKYQMWIKEGTDRTYSSGGSNAVIFSDDLKNMTIESDQSALYSNVAIGAGEGTGNYREYSYYDEDGSTPTATGFERREVFVDAGDATDSDEIKRMSVLELTTAKQLSIKIRVLPSCQWVFGTDYNVGDTVTLIHPQRGQMDLQIFSAEYVRRQTGDELYLNLGSRSLTAPRLINRVASANTYSRK